MPAMHWTNARILEFLNLLEQEPIIWHPRHPSSRNSYELRKSWFRIRGKMSGKMTVSELKRKRDSLMAAFRSITNKMKGGEIYRTNWFAYKTMARFLGDIYQAKSNEDTKDSSNFIELPELIKDDSNTSEDEEFNEADVDNEANDANADNDANVSVSSKTSNTYAATAFKLPTHHERHLRKRKDVCLCQFQDRDVSSLYTQLLAKKLRCFDEYTREVLMHEIDNFVFGVKRRRTSLNVPVTADQNIFESHAIDQSLLDDQKL